jgi:hypothetical protein
MKQELLLLQSQRDLLKSKLQGKLRLSQFDKEFQDDSKKLRKLDGLFFRLCLKKGFELSKQGRLL